MIDTQNDLIIRTTITDIIAKRDHSLKEYLRAGQLIEEASNASWNAIRSSKLFDVWKCPTCKMVVASGLALCPKCADTKVVKHDNSYNRHLSELRAKIGVKIRDLNSTLFEKYAIQIVDTDAWAHIMEISTLEQYMDKKAKDQLRQQLLTDPPPCTEENVLATLQQMFLDSGMMFRRGVAEAFTNLDKRFMSHDGWKIGNRIILFNALNEYGWSYHGNLGDVLHDVERVFRFLAKMQPITNRYDGISGKVERARKRRDLWVEDEFFRIRMYQNNNAHIWFKDQELLFEVNKMLAEYYGSPIPQQRSKNRKYEHVPKTSLVNGLAYYKTPDKLAESIVDRHVELRDGMTILEPSAGCGSIVKAILNAARDKKIKVHITAVEFDIDRCEMLEGLGVKVIQGDFLAMQPGSLGEFDQVVMNPPFNFGEDITHVLHAAKFLKDKLFVNYGGRDYEQSGNMCAIMSAGTVVRDDKNARQFQKMVGTNEDTHRGTHFQWLPLGSFSESGTNVNTIVAYGPKRIFTE